MFLPVTGMYSVPIHIRIHLRIHFWFLTKEVSSMRTIRASRIAAFLLAVFLIIGLFPTAGLAEEDPGEAAPVAESAPEDPPAEPEPEEVEAQEVEEIEWVPEQTADEEVPDVEIPDEEVPEALPALPEEQVQDTNTDEQVEPETSEPADDNTPTDLPEDLEDQVQAQSIEGDVEAAGVDEPGQDDSDDSTAAFTVTLEDYTCEYNGEEQWNTNTPVCEPSDETTTYAFAFSFEEEGEYTDDLTSLKKTDAGEYTIYVKATNQDCDEATTTAKLIINKLEVTVKVEDCTAEYTGSEQSGSKELVFEGLLDGHQATINYEPATGTEVGTYEGSFGEESIAKESFKVIEKPVKEDTSEEDATEEDATEEDATEEENTAEEEGENTTDDENDTPETDVTSNYILKEMTPGKLEIEKIEATVTITGNSETKTYSGNAYSISGYEVSAKAGETVIPNTEFTVELAADKKAEAVGTDSGTYPMGLTKDDFTVTNPNCSNITVEYTDGVLTIQKMPVKVTITGHNDKSVYDGKEHSVNGYDVECSENLYAQNANSYISFTGNDKAARTNVSAPSQREGTTYMGLNEDQFVNTNTNFKVQFEVVDGYQTIERKRLIVKTGAGEKVYDGKPLKNAEASLSGLIEGETATVVAMGEQTNVGKSYNTYEIKWGTAKVGNYVLANSRGILSVTQAPLTIKVKPQSYEYNGKPQGEDNKTYKDPAQIDEKVEVIGLQGKEKLLSITLNGLQTEVGTYEKEKSIALSNVKIGTDPKSTTYTTKNYDIHWSRSTLTITEATSGSSSNGSSSNGSSGSGSSGYSGSSDSGYESYGYSGGYSNTTNSAQAESAVVSFEVPLEIGVVNTGTGESYE